LLLLAWNASKAGKKALLKLWNCSLLTMMLHKFWTLFVEMTVNVSPLPAISQNRVPLQQWNLQRHKTTLELSCTSCLKRPLQEKLALSEWGMRMAMMFALNKPKHML